MLLRLLQVKVSKMCTDVFACACVTMPTSDSGRRSERETEHYDGAKNAATGIQGGRRREEHASILLLFFGSASVARTLRFVELL